MEATLLGTSDAYGVPAPLCDCEYCVESETRRRPAVLIQTESQTICLDAGPDIKEQLHNGNVYHVDQFYVTHHHFDHIEGLSDLFHITLENNYLNSEEFEHPTHGKNINVRAPEYTVDNVDEDKHHLMSGINFEVMGSSECTTHGSLSVESIPVNHGRRQTYGFAVKDEDTGEKLVYAPDMAGWYTHTLFQPEEEAEQKYANADTLVIEGAEVVGPEIHGSTEVVMSAIEKANADNVFLVNVSEHTAEMHTDDLIAEAKPYNIVSDYTKIL
jgi:phosphoribosyl 1,2-cyclic phosphate phosphodiesterase